MAAWLQNASTWLVDHHWGPYLFALLVLVAFAECAVFLGFVVPGETALVLGGALSATGVFRLALFWPAAVLAVVAGGWVGYRVGKRYGPAIRTSTLGRRLGDHRWAAAQTFFDKHGNKAVFFGRSVALLRALIPALAGMSGHAARSFAVWNVVGGVLWGSAVVLLGYGFAHSLTALENGLKYWTYAIVALIALGLVTVHLRRRARDHAAAPGPEGTAAP
jgi:membrane-associated protein